MMCGKQLRSNQVFHVTETKINLSNLLLIFKITILYKNLKTNLYILKYFR